jgi:DNA invertase Pin-like site-specific DNA recombinase
LLKLGDAKCWKPDFPEGKMPNMRPGPAPAESAIRAGIYVRVSTVDQNPDLQILELREFCQARRWQPAAEFVDHGVSGIDSRRPGLRELLQACHFHTIDAVLVWRLDRLARSLADLVRLTRTFESLGINFVSLKNPGLDTTTPQGRLFFGISAVFAEFERELIIERTRAGVAAARARGKTLGRPRCSIEVDQVWKLHSFGLSSRAIGQSLGISHTSVISLLKDRRNGERRDGDRRET